MDIVFLLLCFFVTSSVFSQWETEVAIKLPTAESATIPGRKPGEVILNLNADGEVVLNTEVLALADVPARLKGMRYYSPDPGQEGIRVIIRADKTVSYETLMSLIDACREAGVWNFSFATEDDEKGE